MMRTLILSALTIFLFNSCKTSIKKQEDKVYSRHLQTHIPLTIITTPMPDDKSKMNLLLLNGDIVAEYSAREIMDSLWRNDQIQPVTIVSVGGSQDFTRYLSQGKSELAYENFVTGELLPFIRKKAVIRKFRSVAIFGEGDAGVQSAWLSWNNADKLNISGIVLTGADTAYTRIVNERIRGSRKRPNLDFRIYGPPNAGGYMLIQSLSLKKQSVQIDSAMISKKSQFAGFIVSVFPK